MKCPNCLVDLVISERKNIEIDFCPKCRGIWLDRGELDKMIELSTSFEVNTPSEKSQKFSGEERGDNNVGFNRKHPGKRKESFLGDLLDF